MQPLDLEIWWDVVWEHAFQQIIKQFPPNNDKKKQGNKWSAETKMK